MSLTDKNFPKCVEGKKIPILTLDHKWHKLFTQTNNKSVEILDYEKKLNALLKHQGKLTTESKSIKKIKKQLMDKIVELVDENSKDENNTITKKIDENKRLLQECNEKLEKYNDELLELPGQIAKVNELLMIETMKKCYEILNTNKEDIEYISQWISAMRIELKKNLVRKQEKEIMNQELYSYMHDIFGAEVIEIFDMNGFSNAKN